MDAIDAHAQGVGQWLKVAGMDKAALIEEVLTRRPCTGAQAAVEYGSFVGYTSVRLTNRLRSGFHSLRSVSLEVDHVHQAVSRRLLALTGLSPWGEIWNGQVRDLIPRVIDELGAQSAGFLFMDHRGTRFHEDLAHLCRVNGLASAGYIVADNVLNPGGPIFAWGIGRSHHSTVWSVTEFMSQDREDWMAVIDVALAVPKKFDISSFS